MCVEILYRELFHIGEKVITEVSERTLSYVYHYPVICIRCRKTDNVNYSIANARGVKSVLLAAIIGLI